jgi:PAS domain S-box-containing protein
MRERILAHVHPLDLAAVQAAFDASLATKEVTSIDFRLLLPDGRVKRINSTWQIFTGEDGAPVKAIGAFQDISERHAANEKLLQSEQELRQSRVHLTIAQRVASIGSAAIDFRTGKWDWSDENFRIYGLEPGAITPSAETLAAMVHPEDRAGLLSNIPLARSGVTPPPLEYRIVRPDGSERLLRREAALVHDDAGNVIGIVGAVQDVTDLRAAQREKQQAEDRLKEQADLLSSAQRIGRMGSWSLNLRDGKLVWSDATYELFGITPEEFRGTIEHFMSFILPEDMPSLRAAQARITPQMPLLEAQYRIRRPDGQVRWMYERGNATFDAQGNGLTRIGMVSDVTELRNLEAQLRDVMRLEAIGQLTGGIAHDFNNLLAVVLGNAETLTAALKGDARLYPSAQLIVQAAERGADLTRRLLAFARRQPLAPQITDVNKLLLGMQSLLRRTIEGDIDIAWDCDANLWHALIDPPQLENVLLNLCLNARDAMPGGGRLTITTRNAGSGISRGQPIGLPGQFIHIAVSDTGTGMDRQTLSHVFEPFFTTKGVGKGNGLGLSMAYGFIKQSSGQIRIDSEPGMGTTVNLYLPMAHGAADEDIFVDDVVVVRGNYEKILMVEDDHLVRSHVSEMLKTLGYQVTEASNGHEALSVLRDGEDFALLFTDIMLPGGLNGQELAEAAAQLRPEMAILMTSGYSRDLLKNRGSGGHTFPVLNKPYRINELAVMLRRALSDEGETIH